MEEDHEDRISGNYSMKTATHGAGTAQRTQEIETTDISGYSHLRLWRKIAKGQGYKMQSMKFRAGVDDENYYERSIPRIGLEYEDCWNRESVQLYKDFTEVGECDLHLIRWLQIEMTTSEDVHTGDIHFDEIEVSTGGFTLEKAYRGNYKFRDVRINHKKPSDVIEDLAKMQGDFRYVDYEGRVNYFTKQGEEEALWEVSPESTRF
jgi:hypothetical protein